MQRVVFSLMISVMLIMVSSCQRSLEKQLPGEWWASEVKLDADPARYDSARLAKIRQMEQSVYFVFHEDKTVEVKTGASTNINGTWSVGQDKTSIYISMGSRPSDKPVFFGKYEKGRIYTESKSGEMLSMSKIYEKR